MTKNALRLIAVVLFVSLFSPGVIFAQPELRIVQGPENYYDGVLTSLKPINAADAEVIFVNGIQTNARGHEDGLKLVSAAFPGLDVIGIYNATEGLLPDIAQGFDDLRQGLGLEQSRVTNPAVDTLLTYLLLYDHEVTIVAHSQGAAITSAALREFTIRYPDRLDRLSRVNVITLGGFAASFPEGPQYLHVVFSSDPVPVAAEKTCQEQRSGQAYRDYRQTRYVVNDGPAPEPFNIPELECFFVSELPIPHEHWQVRQHGLEAYLNVLPLDALPRAHPTSAALAPGLGAIHEVAWSEGGQTLALATDRGIGLYQIDNLDAGPRLLASAEPVLSVAWEPIYGFILASTGKDMTVRVWNANSEEEGGIWHIGVHWGSSVAWSPDGTVRTGGARLAFAGYDNIWVSDPQNPAELTGLLSGPGGVWANSVAWSPDGTRLASGHADAMIRVWTAQPGETPVVFQGHVYEGFGGVLSVAWSPDSRKLVSGGEDGTVRLWDADTGTTLAVLQEHVGLVNSVAWSPDGTRLASGGADGTVRLWNAQTGELLDVLQGHTDQVNSVAWSPDGTRLASGSTDGTVQLWNVSGDITPPQTFVSATVLEGHAGWVLSAAWSPDGTRLASGGYDYTVRVWDMTTGAVLAVLDGHTSAVESVAWSPDGMRLASASSDGTVRVWDVATGAALAVLDGHTSAVQSVAWSPEGARLASASNDGTVRVWNMATGAALAVLEGHTGWVGSVAWSSDGTRLASSGGADSTVRVWDATTGVVLAVLEGHTSSVESVVWSPDGGQLASASRDRTVRVWDVAMGTALVVLEGHMDWVMNVAWSPDGGRLASASSDRTVRVWDAATGATLAVIDGQTEGTLAVAWSPDGKWLATTGFHGTVRLWNVPGS